MNRKHILPPPPEQKILQEYLQLVEEIDLEIERISAALPRNILQCRPGCPECCIEFSIFALEAAVLAGRLKGPDTDRTPAEQHCRFLRDDRCSVYGARPIICRSQGLPIGYLNEESGFIEVSACPRNFPEDFAFSQEGLLLMDRFNERLAELNRRYCEIARLDPLVRISLAELAGGTGKMS
jgi:Fe-S-cluster containining protein